MKHEEFEYAGHSGDMIRAELFAPDGVQSARAVVLVHEVFGLDAFMRSVAERFVRAGYVALLPDLYGRKGVPGPASSAEEPAPNWDADTIRAAVASLPDRQVLGDLECAVQLLRARSDVHAESISAVGFCMGGNYAYLLGCHSRDIAAVVDFYGRIVYADLDQNKPVQPLEMALNLDAPLLGIFAEDDASIPPEHVSLMEERLNQFAKSTEFVVVSGVGHGFFNHLRAPQASAEREDAWKRVLFFLDEVFE